jgi:hypothetical protein
LILATCRRKCRFFHGNRKALIHINPVAAAPPRMPVTGSRRRYHHLVSKYLRKEASMRILPIAAVLALLGSAAVAQTDAPKGYVGAYGPDDPNRPFGGPVPTVNLGPGLNVVGPDGTTKVVKAVPCSRAARGTDGSTTCVGIPGPIGRSGDSREGTTTGASRR